MPNICVNCVRDTHLKQLIKNEGKSGTCSLCGSEDLVLDTGNNRFFELSKALIRYHYSEWDYNPHWGGDGYESLFYGDNNLFFDKSRSTSDDAYESIVLSITDGPVYEDYDKGVSVFAGYGEHGQNPLLVAIKTDLDGELQTIAHRLKSENHFNLESDVKNILTKYREVATSSLGDTKQLYRARVGYKETKRNFSLGFEAETHYQPYIGSDIDAPAPHLATSQRINRPGVSFLYCATNKYTAISEVRPHPGDRVSIAEFRPTRDVSVFDLSDSKLLNFFENDQSLDDYKPLNTLGVFINKTVAPSDRIHYSITQLIADCIRQLGFDGIIFSSSVGDGKNVVLFDQKIVKQIADAADIVLIESVKYHYSQEKMISDKNEYYEDLEEFNS